MTRQGVYGAAVGAVVVGALWAFTADRPAVRAADGQATHDPRLIHRYGEWCTVHFRRPALGLTSTTFTELPDAPTSPGNANHALTVSGKLTRADALWVCIATKEKDKEKEYTIPWEVVLLVEVQPK